MDRYVSDALEGILDSAKVRNSVSNEIKVSLDDFGPIISNALSKKLIYYSSKCMGYPAIWFLFTALNVPEEQYQQRIRSVFPSLLFSLSTSIADDFIDGDEHVGEKDMYVFYVFILAMTESLSKNDGIACHTIIKNTCKSLYSSVILSRLDNTNKNDYVSTDRIGIFFEMIASDYCRIYNLPCADDIIAATRSFGRLCCLIDDSIDFAKDITNESENIIFESIGRQLLSDSDNRLELVVQTANSILEYELSNIRRKTKSISSNTSSFDLPSIKVRCEKYISQALAAAVENLTDKEI